MKKISALLLCLVLLLCACSKPVEEPSTEATVSTEAPTEAPTTQQTEPATESVTEPVTEPVNLFVSPLTGLPMETEYDQLRPSAVMINNIRGAMPQCGTSNADVIYEVLAEGGITRMMAIFSNLEGDTPLGSIRSLRPYYLSIARSYDAIVVHAGGSEQAYSDLETTGWDHIDGVRGANSGSYYYRVQARIDSAGYEHSLFINMEDAVDYARYEDCREYHEDFPAPFTFTDAPLTEGEVAEQVAVSFRSGGKETSFTYDPETGLYTGAQYGEVWADGNDGTELTFRNLLVLYAETKTVDDYGRLAVTLLGSGQGYYIRDGRCIPITWSRDAEDAPFRYTTQGGEPLELGAGKTYVAITPPESPLELG